MLSFARGAIRVANFLNWALGALIAAMVAAMLLAVDHFRPRLVETEGVAEAHYYLIVLAIALVLPTVPMVHAIFVRLRALIDTAETDHCFSDTNADRLVAIGWSLVGINLVDIAFGLIDLAINADSYFGWWPSLTGWFAALLLFVLAGIFRRGAAMRADLEGTV